MSIHSRQMYLLLFYFALFILPCFSQNRSRVDVTTSRGALFGYYFDQGNDTTQLYYGQADVFLGIPYAQQPIGELRLNVGAYKKI